MLKVAKNPVNPQEILVERQDTDAAPIVPNDNSRKGLKESKSAHSDDSELSSSSDSSSSDSGDEDTKPTPLDDADFGPREPKGKARMVLRAPVEERSVNRPTVPNAQSKKSSPAESLDKELLDEEITNVLDYSTEHIFPSASTHVILGSLRTEKPFRATYPENSRSASPGHYHRFQQNIQRILNEKPTYAELGNISKDNRFLIEPGDSYECASLFLNEFCQNARNRFLLKKKYNSCLSFTTLAFDHDNKTYKICLVAISGFLHDPDRFSKELNTALEEFCKDKVISDYRLVFITNYNPNFNIALYNTTPPVGQPNNTLHEKSCSEKRTCATISHIFRQYQNVRIIGNVNIALKLAKSIAEFQGKVELESNVESLVKNKELMLISAQNERNMLRVIPCCSVCQSNKNYYLSGWKASIIMAKRVNASLDEPGSEAHDNAPELAKLLGLPHTLPLPESRSDDTDQAISPDQSFGSDNGTSPPANLPSFLATPYVRAVEDEAAYALAFDEILAIGGSDEDEDPVALAEAQQASIKQFSEDQMKKSAVKAATDERDDEFFLAAYDLDSVHSDAEDEDADIENDEDEADSDTSNKLIFKSNVKTRNNFFQPSKPTGSDVDANAPLILKASPSK